MQFEPLVYVWFLNTTTYLRGLKIISICFFHIVTFFYGFEDTTSVWEEFSGQISNRYISLWIYRQLYLCFLRPHESTNKIFVKVNFFVFIVWRLKEFFFGNGSFIGESCVVTNCHLITIYCGWIFLMPYEIITTP